MPSAPTPIPASPALAALYRYVPAIGALPTYRWLDARADFVAGLTVAAVAVPQAMAYAMVAGVEPQYGLYTAVVMTFVGALFDSSRQLINGPTNATSIAVLSATAMVADPAHRLEAVVTLGFLIALVQLGITFLRLGDLTRYISHSVIVGFTLGAGTLLVLDQLKNLLGLTSRGSPEDHFLMRLLLTVWEGGAVHHATLAIGLSTIALVIGLRWLKERLGLLVFPELLAVVVLMAAVTGYLHLDEHGVKVVGEIPTSLPPFRVPHVNLATAREMSTSAFAIALLGLLEALAMAKGIAQRTGQRLDLNQQCLSEGLANLSGSFFQCIPGSGSLTRSAINQQAGAATQWSGVWSAGAVLLIMLLFGSWARYIPRAALAGLLIVTAWRMVDKQALWYNVKATRFDAIIVFATAISAVAISVEFCILIGVFLSFMLVIPRAGRMMMTEFVVTHDHPGMVHERFADDVADTGILVFGLEGELFFGAVPSLEPLLDTIEGRIRPETRVVVLRVKRVRNPDAIGTHMLDGFVRRLHGRGVHVLLCGVREDLNRVFVRTGLVDLIHPDHVFLEQPVRQTSTAAAVRHALTLRDKRTPRPPA